MTVIHVVEMIVVGLIALGILYWVGTFVFMVPWMLFQAVRGAYRLKRHACPECKARFTAHAVRPVDQMYSSQVNRWTCLNGHVLEQGNRHFAEW